MTSNSHVIVSLVTCARKLILEFLRIFTPSPLAPVRERAMQGDLPVIGMWEGDGAGKVIDWRRQHVFYVVLRGFG